MTTAALISATSMPLSNSSQPHDTLRPLRSRQWTSPLNATSGTFNNRYCLSVGHQSCGR